MPPEIGPEEALQRALSSLLDGPGDPRSVDGARINALQSIAWSLVGILSKDLARPESPDEAVASLVERAGLLARAR